MMTPPVVTQCIVRERPRRKNFSGRRELFLGADYCYRIILPDVLACYVMESAGGCHRRKEPGSIFHDTFDHIAIWISQQRADVVVIFRNLKRYHLVVFRVVYVHDGKRKPHMHFRCKQ